MILCDSCDAHSILFQYMQQQSQIFVFSTALANKGAEAVRSGQFSTIIAYHCAQPETKKFLQVIFALLRRLNSNIFFAVDIKHQKLHQLCLSRNFRFRNFH